MSKLRRVHQRPSKVFNRLLAITDFVEVCGGSRQFVVGRLAAERAEVELGKEFVVVFNLGEQAAEDAAVSSQAAGNLGGVHHRQRLRDRTADRLARLAGVEAEGQVELRALIALAAIAAPCPAAADGSPWLISTASINPSTLKSRPWVT